MSGPKSAQMVLQNPTVDTAVFEVARGGILREGLGYDRNDVAVVTNVTGDHLGLGGIDYDRPAGQRQGRRRRGRAALGDGGPQRRRQPRLPDGPPLRRAGRPVQHVDDEGRGRLRPGRRPHAAAAAPRSASRPSARGRADRPAPRLADDAGPVHAPHPGDVRRPGADERRERAGRGRRGVGRGRAPPRHPPGPADLLDVVLPGARPAQPARRRRRPGRHRLLPQRRRHAPAGRLRRPDDGRAARPRPAADRAVRRRTADRAARSASSASRATGATRTSASTGRSRPARSTRSSSARTRTCAAGSRARPRRNVLEGVRAAQAAGTARATRADKVLDEMTAVRSGAPPRDPGRSRRLLRGRRDRASTARRWPRPAGAAAGRRSPIPASWKRPRASPPSLRPTVRLDRPDDERDQRGRRSR